MRNAEVAVVGQTDKCVDRVLGIAPAAASWIKMEKSKKMSAIMRILIKTRIERREQSFCSRCC